MKNLSKKGFTLIELLVVTAIIGVLAIVSATVFNTILSAQNKTAIVNEIRQNGNIIIDKLDRDIKQASRVCATSELLVGGCGGTDTSITVTLDTNIVWSCDPAGESFIRDSVSVTNSDSRSGVRIAASPPSDGHPQCQFTVTDPSLSPTQIIEARFTLEQRNPSNRAELQSQVPFQVTVGTR